MNKAVLILVDGMRPDGMTACGHPEVQKLMAEGKSTLRGRTVMPSVTLPCHMSLMHSVDPERHGVLTNTFTPQVRPVMGLFAQLAKYDKKNAFFYGWCELKDLYQPETLADAVFISGHSHPWDESCDRLTAQAAEYLRSDDPDFLFLYLGEVDEVGHKYGWMSAEYLRAIHHAFDCIEKIRAVLPEDSILLVTADHGGHDRSHGTDQPEDMTIPFLALGKPFEAETSFDEMNIKDIAPTIASWLGVPADKEWEGKSLL